MKNRYPVVALCGDVKFGAEFAAVEEHLTLQGDIVLSPGVFERIDNERPVKNPRNGRLQPVEILLADMQRSKIDMANSMYVVNPGNQMNNDTWSAICYAHMTNKKILSLVPINPKKIDETTNEHIARAEQLAREQLDGARHEAAYGGFNPEYYTCFKSKGQFILNPWVSEYANAHDSSWEDHKNPDVAVEPFEHYGRKRIARFVEQICMERGGIPNDENL